MLGWLFPIFTALVVSRFIVNPVMTSHSMAAGSETLQRLGRLARVLSGVAGR